VSLTIFKFIKKLWFYSYINYFIVFLWDFGIKEYLISEEEYKYSEVAVLFESIVMKVLSGDNSSRICFALFGVKSL